MKYESAQRDAENAIRREARNALASKGIIATETEIRRWRAARQAERDAAAEEARAEARAALDAIESTEAVETSTVARLAHARDFGADSKATLAVVPTEPVVVAVVPEGRAEPPAPQS